MVTVRVSRSTAVTDIIVTWAVSAVAESAFYVPYRHQNLLCVVSGGENELVTLRDNFVCGFDIFE